LSQIIAEVRSLPRGGVNIFTESGNTGAPHLVASPHVQLVSYTGSSAVGRMVAAGGAPTLKRMNLELGGKTPMIVFDDADLDATVPLLAAALTTFAGQFCMTGSRILVQRGVAHEVRTRLADILESVRLGNGLDPETDMGPLIDKATVARVDGMVEEGLAYAKPIVRGGPVTDGALADRAFYRPALLEVDDVNSEIVQKEVFGPIDRLPVQHALVAAEDPHSDVEPLVHPGDGGVRLGAADVDYDPDSLAVLETGLAGGPLPRTRRQPRRHVCHPLVRHEPAEVDIGEPPPLLPQRV
jgi:betaine-aldehyde dehydrogenase